MPKSDAVSDALADRFKTLENLIKTNNERNERIEADIKSLRGEVTSFKDQLQQTVEHAVQEKFTEISSAFDEKIEAVQKEINDAVTNASI